jgi:hypothetical protein
MNYIPCPSHIWFKAMSVLLLAVVLMSSSVGCTRRDTVATTQPEATLDELSSAASAWLMMKGKLPQNVNELTNIPSLKNKRLPTPPPGKKLAINPATQRVVFVDE